jgi:hypothetical protein
VPDERPPLHKKLRVAEYAKSMAQRPSSEGAQERSPRRKPWGTSAKESPAPEGRKKTQADAPLEFKYVAKRYGNLSPLQTAQQMGHPRLALRRRPTAAEISQLGCQLLSSAQVMINRRFPVLHFALEPLPVVAFQIAVAFRRESRISVANVGTSPLRA